MSGPPRGHSTLRDFEVAIVGGGPAGLSAALILGRCCRRVLLCDSGHPRNARSLAVRGFLTRDGVTPAALRKLGRKQLDRYATVELCDVFVMTAERADGGFSLVLSDGSRAAVRKLLLATGMVDQLPAVVGLSALWGRGVFPCPYCDAFEYRGGPLGVLGRGKEAVELCRALTGWTSEVILFSDGPSELSHDEERGLRENGIRIVEARIQRLEGRRSLESVRVGDEPVRCAALFVSAPQRQHGSLVESLGCKIGKGGCVETGEHESTNVPGLYVAGDASANVQFAIVAAAEGAEAAFAIHRALVREDFAHQPARKRSR